MHSGVIARPESFALGQNAKHRRISIRDPTPKNDSANEHDNAGQQAFKEVEDAYCGDTREIEDRAINTQISERLAQPAKSRRRIDLALGVLRASAGLTDEARNVMRELTGKAHVTAYFVSRIYAALGESKEAIDWLEIAYKQHSEWMVLLKTDLRFDGLHDNPRFQNLMRRMNFPEPIHTAVPSRH